MENKKVIYTVLAVCIAVVVAILGVAIFGKGGDGKGNEQESQMIEQNVENAGPADEQGGAEPGDIEVDIGDLF